MWKLTKNNFGLIIKSSEKNYKTPFDDEVIFSHYCGIHFKNPKLWDVDFYILNIAI